MSKPTITRAELRKVLEAFSATHWHLKFEEFKRRTGFEADEYAKMKFSQWQILNNVFNVFDVETLAKILGCEEE